MYFPSDMNFQYFFFSTYIGDFLQMIPIALLTCVGFTIYKKWREPSRPLWSAVLMSLFPAYLFSLIGLTLFSRMIGDAYYILFYHQMPWPEGEGGYRWLSLIYDFKLDFFLDFSAENLGNILLFLPFGILYPLFRPGSTWQRTFALGVLTSLVIENIQPLMDRSFDINDIVLNTIGVAVSTVVFFSLSRFFGRKDDKN